MNIFENDFPQIMGIVNVTPDSFSDGGKYYKTQNAINHALTLIEEGADILDIGGESTRPGADEVSIEEEIKRVIPVISAIKNHNPDIPISIDTTKYQVALRAFEAGATIINDISGLNNDTRLAELAAEKNLSLIIMHIQGVPRTMQQEPTYENVVDEVFQLLRGKINFAKSLGVNSIYADIGIGFGKTLEHNIKLLKNLDKFYNLKVPMLLGISRKNFIGKISGIEKPEERDFPTSLIHALLLNYNINIVRVHDVKKLMALKKIFLAFKEK